MAYTGTGPHSQLMTMPYSSCRLYHVICHLLSAAAALFPPEETSLSLTVDGPGDDHAVQQLQLVLRGAPAVQVRQAHLNHDGMDNKVFN